MIFVALVFIVLCGATYLCLEPCMELIHNREEIKKEKARQEVEEFIKNQQKMNEIKMAKMEKYYEEQRLQALLSKRDMKTLRETGYIRGGMGNKILYSWEYRRETDD